MKLWIGWLRRRRTQGAEQSERATENEAPGRSVLLVDLAGEVAAFPEQKLRSGGFGLRLVRGEEEALAALAQGQFSAIVVSGRARVPFFRALRAATRAPILALDRGAQEGHMLEAFAAGVDQFQAQPISPDEVAARLMALLRRG